jgi:hypothetical protein
MTLAGSISCGHRVVQVWQPTQSQIALLFKNQPHYPRWLYVHRESDWAPGSAFATLVAPVNSFTRTPDNFLGELSRFLGQQDGHFIRSG